MAAPSRSGVRLRILAALVGAVAIWLALWKGIGFSGDGPHAVDFGAAPTDKGRDARPTVSEPSAVDASSPSRSLPTGSSPPVATAPPAPEAIARIRLFGTILHSADGTQLAGPCSVRIVDGEWEERSLEAQSGTYELVDLHPGLWEITATSEGFLTLRTTVVLGSEEKEKQLDLSLRPALVVQVRVESSLAEDLRWSASRDGLRITGLREHMMHEASSPVDRALASAFPRSVALAIVATLEEPRGWLEVETGRDPGIGRFVAHGLQDATFRGPAVDSGTREGLRSLGYAGENASGRLADGSDLGGLPPECCGALELFESPPAFASLVVQGFVLRTVPIAPGVDVISFSLSTADLEGLPSRLRMRVVDAETDVPPDGLRIHFGEGTMTEFPRSSESDGSQVFGGLLPGPMTVKITAPDREFIAERILVQPGRTMDLGTYRMQRFSLVQAKVIDDEGNPASVLFNVFPFDRYEATREALAERFFRSSKEGELKIDSVGRGRYLIVANEPGWTSVPAMADTTYRQKDRIEIRVSRGTSVVLRLRADPPPGSRLAIRTGTGITAADRKCSGREPMRFLLAPGTYSAELRVGDAWLWSEALAVGQEPLRRLLPR